MELTPVELICSLLIVFLGINFFEHWVKNTNIFIRKSHFKCLLKHVVDFCPFCPSFLSYQPLRPFPARRPGRWHQHYCACATLQWRQRPQEWTANSFIRRRHYADVTESFSGGASELFRTASGDLYRASAATGLQWTLPDVLSPASAATRRGYQCAGANRDPTDSTQ